MTWTDYRLPVTGYRLPIQYLILCPSSISFPSFSIFFTARMTVSTRSPVMSASCCRVKGMITFSRGECLETLDLKYLITVSRRCSGLWEETSVRIIDLYCSLLHNTWSSLRCTSKFSLRSLRNSDLDKRHTFPDEIAIALLG